MAAEESAQDIIFQSYLEKESLYLKELRTRWIVLRTDGKLYCYKTKSMKSKPTEIIDTLSFSTLGSNNLNELILISSSKLKNKNRLFKSKDRKIIMQWTQIIPETTKALKSSLSNKSTQVKPVNIFAEETKENDIHTALIACARNNGQVSGTGKYIHSIDELEIDCPYLIKEQYTNNPLKCPIYQAMKEKYQYTMDNLYHLQQYNHYQDEYTQKPKCKYGDECKTYIRCEIATDQNRIEDKCHMKIYRHPPRTRQVKLAQNIHAMIINEWNTDNYPIYEPTEVDEEQYGWKYGSKDGYLSALIEEVIDNGYKHDLCTKCGDHDDCKHNVYNSEHSILKIVEEKMKHQRHILMGSPLTRDNILALILYTGLIYLAMTISNYDAFHVQAVNATMIYVNHKEMVIMKSGYGSIIVYIGEYWNYHVKK